MKIYEVIFKDNYVNEKAKSIVIAESEEHCKNLIQEELFGEEGVLKGQSIDFIITELVPKENNGVLCTEFFY